MKKIISILAGFTLCFQPAVSQISIDPSQTYQTIEGFAASDCWTTHYVGKYWNTDKKELAAKLLFSQNLKADGSPEGIGLSMWRVNIGAGTMEQGDASGLNDIARRAECFVDNSGKYDWTKQAGQQWFMQKAKEYGCQHFVAFSNSPPVYYTINGKGYSGNSNNANLREDKYDAFADFLTTVVEHFRQEGYNFSYISPVNEPQWGWNSPDQEGSPWRNDEIKKVVVELNKSIQTKELDTKILITEAGDYTYLYANSGHRAGDQIYQFFNANSANYVGNLPAVAKVAAGHSYWTHGSNTQLRNTRVSVDNRAKSHNVGVFQTEWSLLGESPGENFPGYDAASYMDIALILARVIHSDLAYANVSSWSYWTAMGQEMWGHKDRFLLLSLSPGNPPNAYNLISQSGLVTDRSTLWALGNYSFFVRPGYQRIKLTGADNLGGLMGTAYIAPDRSRIVAVYVNMSYSAQRITTGFTNLPDDLYPVTNKVYVTTDSYNLRKYGSASSETYTPEREITLLGRSVATIVYELNTLSAIGATNVEKTIRVSPNPVTVGGNLTLHLPENVAGNLTVSIYSTQGNKVYTMNSNCKSAIENFTLPAYLAQGVYLLNIHCGDQIYSHKLLIN